MYPAQLQSAMYGFLGSSILFACHRMGILATLAREPGCSLAALADLHGADQRKLERLLNAACSICLLEFDKANERYQMPSELKRFLDPDSDESVGGFIDHLCNRTYLASRQLADCVLNGVEELSPEAVFRDIYQSKGSVDSFSNAMWNISIRPSRELVQDEVFTKCRKLIDLGGGPGALAIAAAEAHPDLHAVVYDMSAIAGHFDGRAKVSPAHARLSFHAGDFWRDDLPSADTYALGYILSDWSTPMCEALLLRIRDALPHGGHLLILEKLFDEGARSPLSTVMLDLAMLVETVGQHRTEIGYRHLLDRSGFSYLYTRRSSGEKHMIVATKR